MSRKRNSRTCGRRRIADFIDERSIEAGAYFHTEVEEFAEADVTMRNTRDYAPEKSDD